MERLTSKSSSGRWFVLGKQQAAIDRLAAYEDTGLEPEEIVKMGMMFEDSKRYSGRLELKLKYYEDLEEQGRLHISKAYCCPKCSKHELTPRIDGEFYYCFGCKTQFTRAEAEAALAHASDVGGGT